MASIRNFDKDNYKMYFENPKKIDKKTRSSSKKKQESKSPTNQKSVSPMKDNSTGNLKSPILASSNGNNSQNMPNNININVNNLIINHPTPNINIYPNNYGVYLSNSSVFSKLGSDIMNSKMNNNSINNFSKKYQMQNQPSDYMGVNLNMKNNNGAKINFNNLDSYNSLNNINSLIKNSLSGNESIGNLISSGLGSQYSKKNLGGYSGLSNANNSSNNNSKSTPHKFANTLGKNNSLVDNVINNILDGTNKKPQLNNNVGLDLKNSNSSSVDSSEIKVNSSLNIGASSINNNSNVSSSSLNINEHLNNLDLSLNKNNNNTDNVNVLTISNEVLDSHITLWENLIDIETNSDNKQNLSVLSKKLTGALAEEILKKNLNFEIFSNASLNKAYMKVFKIASIMMIYFKFVLLDFNYENNLKANVKKMVNGINEHLLNIIDNFILSKDQANNKISKEFLDKYNKIVKFHKIKKNKESVNGNSIYKNLEVAINNIKQFSNNFFKIGYFKPIHTICIDFFRALDSYTLNGLLSLIMNNVLYYVNNYYPNIEKKTISISNKQLVFHSPGLVGMNNNNNNCNISPPFLPTVSNDVYTLVLDLDETLVHFFFTPSGGTFLIRPGAMEFLQQMSEMYEIVIFTAAMKDYADNILDILDKDKTLIKYRLYRHHTSISGMSFVKDLSKIGRDLSKVMIIDNLPENFKLQQNNGFFIKTWNEDMKDTQLYDFTKLLKDLYLLKVPDVRNVLKKMKEEVNRRLKKNVVNPYANLDVSKYL